MGFAFTRTYAPTNRGTARIASFDASVGVTESGGGISTIADAYANGVTIARPGAASTGPLLNTSVKVNGFNTIEIAAGRSCFNTTTGPTGGAAHSIYWVGELGSRSSFESIFGIGQTSPATGQSILGTYSASGTNQQAWGGRNGVGGPAGVPDLYFVAGVGGSLPSSAPLGLHKTKTATTGFVDLGADSYLSTNDAFADAGDPSANLVSGLGFFPWSGSGSTPSYTARVDAFSTTDTLVQQRAHLMWLRNRYALSRPHDFCMIGDSFVASLNSPGFGLCDWFATLFANLGKSAKFWNVGTSGATVAVKAATVKADVRGHTSAFALGRSVFVLLGLNNIITAANVDPMTPPEDIAVGAADAAIAALALYIPTVRANGGDYIFVADYFGNEFYGPASGPSADNRQIAVNRELGYLTARMAAEYRSTIGADEYIPVSGFAGMQNPQDLTVFASDETHPQDDGTVDHHGYHTFASNLLPYLLPRLSV